MKPPRRPARIILTDAFDDECFERMTSQSKAFAKVVEPGARLYPHFRELCHDLFAVLFKLDINRRPPSETAPSARVSHFVLRTFCGSEGYARAHERTALDEEAAARAMLRVARVVLRLIKTEELLRRDEMMRLHELDEAGDELAEREEEAASAEELAERADERHEEALQRTAEELREEIERLREAAERAEQEVDEMVEGAASAVEQALRDEADQVVDRLSEHDQAMHDFREQMGVSGSASAQDKLDLGEELADNDKLRLLAKMVGVFREVALAERRRTPLRRAAEVHDVALGADLGHLLPSELLRLRRPQLKRVFRRSYLERSLLQYDLRTEAEAGRGPAVVCIDVSSSMQGGRELWAKAVALTLLEIARRQRRELRVLCFSAGPRSVAEFPLSTASRSASAGAAAQQAELLRLASYFPGGGTDFQAPLSRAMDIIREQRTRKHRSDIVLITDGESAVDASWLDRFMEDKAAFDVRVFTVLIDLKELRMDAVKRFSDRITSVSKLTAQEGRDLFLKF